MSPRALSVLAAVLSAAALAGCASADKHNTQTTATQGTTGSSNMAGMDMTGGSDVATEVPSVNGIKPVASQVLATADWQGMEIQARTMTPYDLRRVRRRRSRADVQGEQER